MNELCNLKDAKQAMIDGIRQDYSTKLDTVNQITDNFLNTEVGQLKAFLSLTKSTAFAAYEQIQFCEKAASYSSLT